MKRTFAILSLALLMTLSLATVTSAGTMPVAGCPTGFTLMAVMQHDDMEHTYVA